MCYIDNNDYHSINIKMLFYHVTSSYSYTMLAAVVTINHAHMLNSLMCAGQ